MADELVNLTIDGTPVSVPKGTLLIEAAKQAGVLVPHYCYHPGLPVAGVCRMCLVDVEKQPTLSIACATQVAEGMVVHTQSDPAKKARQSVLEFLLINHPLDCPICDQAGECELQEFSVEYGAGGSRFLENKVKKPKAVQLGPRVTLDDERCILCSRCVRFCNEIVKDDVLGFIDRGSHTVLTAHPGKRLENNYSLNTVDLCPVGALTSTDFRFKMRVWFLKETKSICTSCATGCNTLIGTREDIVYRQTPRENDDVNSCWMCDYGRLNFKYLEADNRLLEPQIFDGKELASTDWKSAIGQAALQLKKFAASEIAIVA